MHDELNELNPSAATSLMEGLEETLTLHDLQVHARLRRSLSSTNGIESSFSVVARSVAASNAGRAAIIVCAESPPRFSMLRCAGIACTATDTAAAHSQSAERLSDTL
jgi:hypothetical protein